MFTVGTRATALLAMLPVTAFLVDLRPMADSDVASSMCQTVGVPAYFRPEGWDRAVAGSPTVRHIILNPASGPGPQPEAGYVAVVQQAQASGIAVVGYVDTSYGRRDPSLVQADIDHYREWYQVDGFLFDQVSKDASDLPYYRQLAGYVRSQDSQFVVLNPGVFPDEGYMDIGDVVITFENIYLVYRDLYGTAPAWVADYQPSRFFHLVYTASEAELSSAVTLARQRGAGTIYVTDQTLPNPWATLPSYWESETELVASSNPASCSPPTDSDDVELARASAEGTRRPEAPQTSTTPSGRPSA